MTKLLGKRIFSCLMAMAVILSMMPTAVWAVNDDTVAVIGSREYTSLQAAIDAATSTSNIQLVKDVNENIKITGWKTCSIDLGENTWSGDGDVLTIDSGTVNLSNGKIKSNTGRGIYTTYGEITLSDMIVQGGGSSYAIEFQYATRTNLNMSGNTALIQGLKVSSSKTLADYLPSGATFVTCEYDSSTGGVTVNSDDFVTTAYTSNEYTGNLALAAHAHQFTDGKCTCGASYIASITSGDQTTLVKTLNSSVLQKSGELKLFNDAEITYDYNKTNYTLNTDGQILTIDLNGHTLTGNLVVESGASLTMKDKSAGASGKLNGNLKVYGGALTVESGTYQYSITSYSQATLNYYSGNLNISGGVFKRDSSHSSSSALRFENTFAEGEVSISNGTFEGIYVSGPTLDKWYALTNGTYRFQKSDGPLTLPEGSQYFDDTVTVQLCNPHTWQTAENQSQYRCSYCGAINPDGLPDGTVAKIGTDNFYTSIGAAVDAVANGTVTGEITLVTNLPRENISVSSGNITINLNGKKWHNGSASGGTSFSALTVEGGTVTVKNGGIYAQKDNYVASAVTVNGGTLIVEDGVILSGTASNETTDNNEPALTVTGGNVTLAVGTVLNNGIKVTVDGKAAADCLSANTAFQHTVDGKAELIDGFATKSTFDNLTVVAHPNHDFDSSTGKCSCGQICTHSYVDGICSICGYICTHESVNESTYKCTVCNTQMTVKTTKDSQNSYAASLAAAIDAAAGGSTLTLLSDEISANGAITGGKALTLDFNGKSFKADSGVIEVGASDTDVAGSTGNALTITGTSEDTYKGNSITVYGGNEFYTDDWSGTLNVFTANKNVTGSVNSGSFRTFKGNYVKWSTLIAAGHAFYDLAGTSFVYKYSDTIGSNIGNTKVMPCTHPSVERGYCVRCHKGPYAAETGGKYYAAIAEAIEAANGGTVKLLANVSCTKLEIQGEFTLDLNNYNIYCNLIITSGTPKLINSAGTDGTIDKLTINGEAKLSDLLSEEWAFKINNVWTTEDELSGKTAANVKVAEAPITRVWIESPGTEVEYGSSNLELIGNYALSTSVTTYGKLYKVEEGKIPEEIKTTSRLCYNLPADLPVGTHNYRFTVSTSDGYSKSCDFTLTVKQASLSKAAVTITEEPTYNGTPQLPEIEVKMGDTNLIEGTDYTITTSGKTDASIGNNKYELNIEGMGNYTGANTAEWQMKPARLTYTVAASPKTYDGTRSADVQVTFNYEENWTHLNEGDYTVTANYENEAVGENKEITGTVELKATETTGNYILADSSFSTAGSITKNIVTDPQPVSLVITNGVAKTYEISLPALPELGEGCEYGNRTYKASVDFGNNAGYYESGVKVENGILILPIEANQTKITGEIGTVTVTVETDNYEDITLTVNVSATNKLTPQLDGELTLTASEITYGDTLGDIGISGTMKVGDTEVDGTFAWQNPDTNPDANDAYSASWVFTPKDQEKYENVTGAVTIAVKKAIPTGKPYYENITESGKTLADAKLSVKDASGNSLFSTDGEVTWKDGNDKSVEQGAEYEWIFTPTYTKNYEIITGKVILWARPASGGGAVMPPAADEDVITVEDKTSSETTTKTTVKDTKTETVKNEQGEEISKVTATVSEKVAEKLVDQAVSNKSDTVEITVKSNDGNKAEKTEIEIPKKAIDSIAKNTDADLVIKTDNGQIAIDSKALETIAASADGDTLRIVVTANTQLKEVQKPAADAIGNIGVAFDVAAYIGNTRIYDLKDGKAEIMLPVPANLKDKDIAVIYISDKGICEIVNHTAETVGTDNFVKFTASQFANYAIVEKADAEKIIDKQNADKINSLIKEAKLKATTSKTSKKSVKVRVESAKNSNSLIKEAKAMGYTVKYKFYRSTSKASKYKAVKTKTSNAYINTVGKKSTKYYYKAKVLVYDGKKLIAQTTLKQCSYGARRWSK